MLQISKSRVIHLFCSPLALLCLGLTAGAFASENLTVQALISDYEIEIGCQAPCSLPPPGARLLIRSQSSRDELGYALMGYGARARVQVHSNGAVIRPGNPVELLDLSSGQSGFRGRTDLIFRGDQGISARYRPMVYLGYLMGEAAANLEAHEHLVSYSRYAYGVHQRLQLATVPLLMGTGSPNIEVKYNFFENDDTRLSISTGALYHFRTHTASGNSSLYFDVYSNARFTTYTRLTFDTQRFFNTPLTPRIYDSKTNTEFQTLQSILLNSWDRIILGPKYSLEQKTLGGEFAYCWVFDHFHLQLGVRTEDFLHPGFHRGGTGLSFDFWWRL